MSGNPQSVTYKESGIPWVGKIPEHWEVKRAKNIFKEMKRPVKESDEIITCFRDGVVTLRKNRRIEGFTNSLKEIGYQGIQVDDLVIHSMDAFAGAIGVSDSNGKATPVYIVCTPYRSNLAYTKYYAFLLRKMASSDFILSLAKGIRERSTDFRYSDFGDLRLPLPPIQEQQAIANFLDKKTHQIEEFITKKQKLITLLEEKKQTLINQCVTQGLDPSTPLKDSGVEWIGKIPTHWEVKKLKLLFGIGSGLGITKADFLPSGIPCVSYGEIHSKYPCRLNTGIHPLPYVSEDYLSSKPQALLKKGDFVFADTSEDIEGSGNFTSLQSDDPVFAGYHTITLKPKTQKIHSPYFSFLFDSLEIRNQVRKEVCGVKVYSVTKSILKEVQCLIPPLEEQKAIAEYLDTQIEKIDLAICKIKSQINLIKEYKTTLISEAVCGRVGLD